MRTRHIREEQDDLLRRVRQAGSYILGTCVRAGRDDEALPNVCMAGSRGQAHHVSSIVGLVCPAYVIVAYIHLEAITPV